MKPVEALIKQCQQLNINLWSEEGKLRYRAPQGVLTPDLRDELIAHKDELVRLLQKVVALPQVQPRPEQRYEPFPLTDIQHAYWIGRNALFEAGNVATHVYTEFRMQEVALPRLNQAWQRVIDHHDMLRMVILPEGVQRILPTVPPYEIMIYDLRGQSATSVAAHLTQVRTAMSHQILPTEQWPLFDIRATRVDETQTLLHFSMDLLLADATSMQLIIHDWVQCYKNPTHTLPALEISFRDYVLAVKQLERTELYQQAQTYWRQRLGNLPPAPELPLVPNATALVQPRFQHDSAQLDQTTWQQIKQRARHFGLTPSDVMLAAFAEVLTNWSKSPRFTLNLTLFNRLPIHPQVNTIVGDFTTINLLVIDHAAALSFAERARRIQQQLWQDLDHSHFSGVQVLRDLARQQGGGQGGGEAGKPRALMPVVFTNVLNLTAGATDTRFLGEMTYSVTQTPQVYLDCYAREEQGILYFGWNAVADLFPAGLLTTMLAAYQTLLQRLAQEEQAWSRPTLSLTPMAQLAQQAQINATQAPPTNDLLHTLFLQQVDAYATAPAVITPQRTLTYHELCQRANQVGHWLRERGAKPNTLVAVVMEKGWEQVVAVLGIHFAGAAYLPIDPTLPTQRLHYLLSQGEVTLALTQAWLGSTLPWPDGIIHTAVDSLWLSANPAAADLPMLDIVQRPTDLAYVIYTSGSTGLPKGVVIDHRGAVNTVLDINERFGVTADDRVLGLSALNFDLSVYDIFGPLAVGGALVLPNAEQRREPAHWLDLLARHKVTVWNTVPALMQMLVDYIASNPVRAEHSALSLPVLPLQVIMLSGDWIPITLPDRIKAHWPTAAIYSLGGATEASIWSIYYPIEEVDPSWTSIPYGKPLRNQTFYVLDEQLNQRPVWVPGDLYIGGIGLALGYWRDEAKTNERFINQPAHLAGSDQRARLYKTGDLGRYLPDGSIEFLGRADFQVKIRGQRIELGEIEATLLQHPYVKDAVVEAVGDPKSPNKQLVAYLVYQERAQNNGLADLDASLSTYLRAKLPAHMVPVVYIALDALPLSANGKVDRQALPRPDLQQQNREAPFVAPRTPTEEQIAQIWCALLQQERVSIDQDFFALGGDSLLAMQALVQMRQTFQLDLALRVLFENPTIAQLGRAIEMQELALAEEGALADILAELSKG